MIFFIQNFFWSATQVSGKPTPKPTPVIVAVTPTIDKRLVAPRRGISIKSKNTSLLVLLRHSDLD